MGENRAGPFEGQAGPRRLIKSGLRGRALIKKSDPIEDNKVPRQGCRIQLVIARDFRI